VQCLWPEMQPKVQLLTALSTALFSAECGWNSSLAAAVAGLLWVLLL
jgi:hypothetical protein